MFYHHILKPEREPLEANVWGTPKSSGAFSTLFERRILRALDYCEDPFELRLIAENGRRTSTKLYGLSLPLFHEVADRFSGFRNGRRVYLACRDSAESDLPPQSVDAVITDPPFFDNVHYSELADFFFVWQRHILGERDYFVADSTRADGEVQRRDPQAFTDRLAGVWKESHRVLKDNGLLIFTYHHSRTEGWRCVLESLLRAGFAIVRVHPIKSEMSVATPKHQANEPIDLDMIIVCRKRSRATIETSDEEPLTLARHAYREANLQIGKLRRSGRRLSRNDIRVIFMAQAIARLSRLSSVALALKHFDAVEASIEQLIERLNGHSPTSKRKERQPRLSRR